RSRGQPLAMKSRCKTQARLRNKATALKLGWIASACKLEECGQQIDYMTQFGRETVARLDARGPARDQGRGDAALVDPRLVPPKRGVRGISPAHLQTAVRVACSGPYTGSVATHGVRPAVEVLRAGTVVGKKQHQGIIFDPVLAKRGH